MVRKTGVLLLLLCSVFLSKADYWDLPTCKQYFSADSSSNVYVFPACITILKKKKNNHIDTCSGNCLEKRPSMATVTLRTRSYTFKLLNPYAPQEVFISNDGKYVISINEWGSAGTGKNVLVFYKCGILLKNYSLLEISPIPLGEYYKTISSFGWFDELRFVSDSLIIISFRDKNGKKFKKTFDMEKIG